MTRAVAVALALGLFAFAPPIARAQDAIPAMPDAGNGPPDPSDYQQPGDLTVPQPDDGPAPHSVTIPVPGGGSVTVEGPDAPADNGIPTNPGGQWGIQQQTPNSLNVGPLGP
ncbi:MAG TPA: hypothetical protein VMA09_22900 [Candidatus Binataceae bacterium]|nr:hypothetical protein [Candidatus Binataceae bacterium]